MSREQPPVPGLPPAAQGLAAIRRPPASGNAILPDRYHLQPSLWTRQRLYLNLQGLTWLTPPGTNCGYFPNSANILTWKASKGHAALPGSHDSLGRPRLL